MGGQSTNSQTQQSTTNPWEPATPALRGLLGGVQTGLNNTAVTPQEQWGLSGLTENANRFASQYAPQFSSYATSLLNGGGASDQAGNVDRAYQDYTRRLSDTAAGGGATDQAGNINQNLQGYTQRLNGSTGDYRTALNGANAGANANLAGLEGRLGGIANGGNIGMNSGLAPYLQTLRDDITNSTNGQFAAAGRDFSGANSMALGRGITQGLAPVIASQYNQDNADRMSAAKSLYDAGNNTNAFTTANAGAGYNADRGAADSIYSGGNSTAALLAGLQQQKIANQGSAADRLYAGGTSNAGILSGMQQQYLANQAQGVTAAGQAQGAAGAPYDAALSAEAARRGIPIQALGLLANIGVPIAGLGGQSTGQANTTNQLSGAQQFGTIANGFGNLLGGAGNFMKFMPSDRKLKEDIEQVGTLFDGTPVYRYRYIGQPAFQIGLMAQDVEKTAPGAVIEINGYKAVDYRAATEPSREMKAV